MRSTATLPNNNKNLSLWAYTEELRYHLRADSSDIFARHFKSLNPGLHVQALLSSSVPANSSSFQAARLDKSPSYWLGQQKAPKLWEADQN